MAEVLKLRRNVTDLDLNAADGLSLDAREGEISWVPRVAVSTPGRIPPPVIEEIPLRLRRTTTDLMAASLQALADMQEGAARYMQDPTEQYPVWLHDQATAETNGRRALVRRILGDPRNGWHNDYSDPNYLFNTLVIERHPYWEGLTPTVLPKVAAAAGITIVYDYTSVADIMGDVPGRLDWLAFRGGGVGNTRRIWCGFRSTKHGAPNLFLPTWECEDGVNNPAESGVVDVIDATASGGDAVQVTETDLNWDNTWQQVMYVQLGDVTADYQEQYGLCLHLLRAKVSAGTWQLQLRHGNMKIGPSYAVRHDPVDVSSTDWNFYEMGIFGFPTRYLHALPLANFADTYDEYDGFYIYARRTSGAGTLTIDCVVRIPVDEGMANLKSQDHELSADLYYTYIGCAPEDRFHVQGAYGAAFTEVIPPVTPNFYLPVGDGRLIICFARSASSAIADKLEIGDGTNGGKYYPRWLSLRGAE